MTWNRCGGWTYGADTYYKFWTQRDFNYTPVNKAGDTMNGSLTVNGEFTQIRAGAPTTGIVWFGNGNNRYLFYDGSNYTFAQARVIAPTFTATGNVWAKGGVCYLNSAGSSYIQYDGTNINIVNPGVASFVVTSTGRVQLSNGLSNKAGFNGGYTGYNFNCNWNGANNYNIWLDGTYVGDMAYVSDYRIKKDVLDLPGMWDTVKALRPIKYKTQEFSTPSHKAHVAKQVAAAKAAADEAMEKGVELDASSQLLPGPLIFEDDAERWGFIAHELQETMVPTAATSVKDAPDALQSPNAMTIIAALTKALQEAMARIETLEARIPA